MSCLDILIDHGYNVYLPYYWNESSNKILHGELLTSTLDGVAKYHLQRLSNSLQFRTYARFLYSQGKSTSTYDSIISEMNYDRIVYTHEHEIQELKRKNIKVSKLPYTKDFLLTSFSNFLKSQLSDKYIIGWFPSIKESAVITPSVISSLVSILNQYRISLLVGIHPSLKQRSPKLYANLDAILSLNHPSLIYTEFVDSYLMISMCNLVIGDVGSTLWDAQLFNKHLLLLSLEDEADYDDRLINTKCFKEWFIGKKIGRTIESDLKSAIHSILCQHSF